jgi:AcrR family transcriptional regulator
VTSPPASAHPARRRAPRPEERRVDGEKSRAALLDAALEEFSAKGFAGTRVRDVAARAGVSKDLIAYHFGSKDGLYLAVQQAWLEREDTFADPRQPIGDLVARYLHDALTDSRPLRLLVWRGLAPPEHPPPDSTAAAEDLSTTRDRQRQGELPTDVNPAALRLVLLAAVAAPIVFPDTARRLFGMAPTDPGFEERYRRDLQRLLAHLATHDAVSNADREPSDAQQALTTENQELRRELDRLRGVLRDHGIEPDADTARTA